MLRNFFMLFALFTTGFLSAQSPLIRTPRISPDASLISFSYQGDIWTYDLSTKKTKRITVHEAYEGNPVWNSKGTSIAFSSNRKEANNIFIVSKEGGLPKQVTFFPSADVPYNWTKEGNILFATSRVLKGPQWDEQIYLVKAKGGTPERLFDGLGSMATQSPDGKFIAYVKGACRISREDYSGSAQRDIWIYNTDTKEYIQITDTPKNDHSPFWDADGNLYFIGAESGRYNIYQQKINSNGSVSVAPKKITNQTKNGVVSYSVSNNGTIVYSTLFDLYIVKNGKQEKLSIQLATDYKFETEKEVTTTSGVSNFDISPSGKLVALEIDGEIFVKKNNKDYSSTNNVSKHFFRDRNPQWISDKELLFVSDRDGYNEIYKVVSTDTLVGLQRSLKLSVSKVTKSKEDVYDVVVSPDHKKVAYRVGRGVLKIADIKSGKLTNTKVYSSSWSEANSVSWSPDSKFIAYSQEDLDFDSEIFIQSVENPNDKFNVSMHPRSDIAPVWSPDGKKLAFASNRSGNRGGIDFDIWMVWLQKEDWERSTTDREDGDYYTEILDNKSKKDKKVEVKIDREKIYNRLVKVTNLPDDEFGGMFSPDSKHMYFSATAPSTNTRGFYKIKIDGKSPKTIKGVSRARNFKDVDGKFYFTSSGRLKELNPKTDKITSLPHKAIYINNFKFRYEQIFDEGTRVLTMGFYDPNFHGYDWSSLINKYKPLVMQASTKQDYIFLFNQLLGQLNASHMGYRSSTDQKTNNDNVGLLGVEVKNTPKGAEVLYVLENSVANKSKVNLKVGDVITLVNGKKTGGNINFYSLLKNTRNQEVLLTLENGRETVARTSGSLRRLQYDSWVESRRKLVDKYSNGQLGYIHIQGMNAPSFESFERELKASGYRKKGIVIDVRYNGGGWTTDRLMAVLNVDQHAYTIPRGAASNLKKDNKKFSDNYPFNERAILSVNTKPSVALCNENSYSNAEIFSHAYKSLDIGKLVGQPTFGAVISTGGYTLMDGFIRMPFRAWYEKKSGGNMENEAPAVPDYLIKNKPGTNLKGDDAQLKKAVDVLLQQVK